MVVAGLACLALWIPTGSVALLAVGAGALVSALCATPFWLVALVRTRRLLARGRDLPGVRFVASRVDPSRGKERQFEPLGLVVADDSGLRGFVGSPVRESWGIPWSDIDSLEAGTVQHGRISAHTFDVLRTSGHRQSLRVADEGGWSATPAYVGGLLSEVGALRPADQAGASQSPPSGGSVSSTDAGRPPQGSATAVTEP